MKRAIILTSLIAVITVTAVFANSQPVVKETRGLAGFTKVSFGISGDLYINIGNEFKVILEGEKDLVEDIVTEVSGGKLIVRKENWRLNMKGNVTVYITMPKVDGLSVSGSGRAEIKDAIKADDLSLNVSGSGKLFTTDVVATKLNCDISGSGDIILGGNGNSVNANINISGSGNYAGEPLEIGSAEIRISGSGNCRCSVKESLKASVSGSGNVTYIGNPKLDARISGSGRVRSK